MNSGGIFYLPLNNYCTSVFHYLGSHCHPDSAKRLFRALCSDALLKAACENPQES